MIKALGTLFGLLLLAAIIGAGGVVYIFYSFGSNLPDYRQLADYEPPVMTRVYAGDGRLLSEYAMEKRAFVPIMAMPGRVVQAFLSAEDKNFYNHSGVDILGVVRAAIINVKNIGSGRRLVGASTITQQVAKNFLLSNELSWKRKIHEAILAFRIERAFTKNRILELYLNQIYLGYGSYGVATAALNYFNKPMDQLTIAEAAFLAALPKAPNNYNPSIHPDAAKARRDWVIGRMLEDGAISTTEAALARATPLEVRQRAKTEFIKAGYFSEEVRRELADRYGEAKLYEGGLAVRTTLDPRLQNIADRTLRHGLEAYDRRHGWRGPITHINPAPDQFAKFAALEPPPGIGDWRLALVIGIDRDGADISFVGGESGRIPFAEMKWARPWLKRQKTGPAVKKPADVMVPGDVLAVAPVETNNKGKAYQPGTFSLRQIPDIDGALVAMNPHTGRVLAMSGGYSYKKSQFNRATQAMRQPGSAFKPVVYLAALDMGYTPSTLILDAPFVIDQGPGLPKWRPANYTQKFYGPSTMRLGLEKSRNLMTVRLAQTIGIDKIAEYAEKLGVVDKLPRKLSMALGAGETTLLRLTTAYSMLVNGGRKITPTLVDRIQDRHGKTIFRHDKRTCVDCLANFWASQPVPKIPDTRKKITSPASAYQIVSMLRGVVQRGTGIRINSLGLPLAGKTGTTNKSMDTWFIGFSPDLAVGVFSGFDKPRTLGRREQGASVAGPIFRDFMKDALAGQPTVPFRIPPGIRLVRVNATTGRPARPGDRKVILEAFKPGTVPVGEGTVLKGYSSTVDAPTSGTGGLY